ncbi:MAG: flagellar basal body rod protein FlgB [Methylobacteriaceae bacterium]|nr:flagellar basal body rod protein FlgB [Methylobacteriaceae bacterium]
MALTDLPIVAALKTRLQWHETRQKLLAENVANANTPGFQPRELVSPKAPGQALAMLRTSPLHLASAGADGTADSRRAERFETRPSGNGVNLEDEMLKVAGNQSDFQLAASLYQKSLSMLRVAVGKSS